MEKTFLKCEKPLITAMICCKTPDECIEKIELSIYEGAEAIGIGLEWLGREYRTKKEMTRIFSACGELPVYVTACREGENKGLRDEDIEILLLKAAECGATLVEIPGDMYYVSYQYGLNVMPIDIYRQSLIIKRIHQLGGEVLMSSRVRGRLSVYEYEMIASEHKVRKSDISGIFNESAIIGDGSECVMIADRVDEIAGGRFLLEFDSSDGNAVSSFGKCMYRCVQSHGKYDSPKMPLLKDVLASL